MSSTKEKRGQLTLKQMLKALDKDVATDLEKKLKKLSKKKAVKVPLDKNKADQIERKVAYSEVSKDISKWDQIVEQNKNAKQINFPLDEEPDGLPITAEAVSNLKPQNELETEVQKIISGSETALRDTKEFTKAEEKYLKAISVEEAQERHRELQRMRVLLNSYGSKMRRQKAIKSKSYRRLLKHERIRKHMKNVESNKDALVEEIERLHRLRAQERASLKHKNTGKWAKHAKFRAKYDEAARKAMIEQIGISERLLERTSRSDSSSEEDIDSNLSEDEESSEEIDESSENKTNPIDPASNSKLIISSELINERSLRRKKKESDDAEGEAMDDEDEDDQRKLMSEAFADDDVVEEFRKAKDQVAGEEQPKDVNLFLPGWGGWAGPGIKISKKKRDKYVIKAKKLPRRDENLGNVIISEHADDKIKELMVKKLPRGIKSREQLRKILTKPTAATFANQMEHRETIKPRIKTRLGARIEPISRETLHGSAAKWA